MYRSTCVTHTQPFRISNITQKIKLITKTDEKVFFDIISFYSSNFTVTNVLACGYMLYIDNKIKI